MGEQMNNFQARINPVTKLVLLLTSWLIVTAGYAQEYVMDPDWPKPLPDGIEWGQVPNSIVPNRRY